MVKDSVRDTADSKALQWAQEEGIAFHDIHQPRRRETGTLNILIDGRGRSARDVAVTIASLLSGRVQRCPIEVLLAPEDNAEILETWVTDEPAVRLIRSLNEVERTHRFMLVCPAGTIFSNYAVEAGVEAMEASGCALLRAYIDGAPRSMELWRTHLLQPDMDLRGAEATARSAGAERWVSGASLGVHYTGHPAPKMFLRKGKAGKFDVDVVVRDLNDPATKHDYQQRIRDLEGALQRSRRNHWAALINPGTAPSTTIASQLLRKGPRFVSRRLRQLARRIGKSA